jgi:hypothetical protein
MADLRNPAPAGLTWARVMSPRAPLIISAKSGLARRVFCWPKLGRSLSPSDDDVEAMPPFEHVAPIDRMSKSGAIANGAAMGGKTPHFCQCGSPLEGESGGRSPIDSPLAGGQKLVVTGHEGSPGVERLKGARHARR